MFNDAQEDVFLGFVFLMTSFATGLLVSIKKKSSNRSNFIGYKRSLWVLAARISVFKSFNPSVSLNFALMSFSSEYFLSDTSART